MFPKDLLSAKNYSIIAERKMKSEYIFAAQRFFPYQGCCKQSHFLGGNIGAK
jgi:hypothetical protein